MEEGRNEEGCGGVMVLCVVWGVCECARARVCVCRLCDCVTV